MSHLFTKEWGMNLFRFRDDILIFVRLEELPISAGHSFGITVPE
jgi:hypothetical protein